jgi:hypothetical protein
MDAPLDLDGARAVAFARGQRVELAAQPLDVLTV